MKKFNSTGVSAGDTQQQSADQKPRVATKRCQRGSTRLNRAGPIFRTVATVQCINVMITKSKKQLCDGSVTVLLKTALKLKNRHNQAKSSQTKAITL